MSKSDFNESEDRRPGTWPETDTLGVARDPVEAVRIPGFGILFLRIYTDPDNHFGWVTKISIFDEGGQ